MLTIQRWRFDSSISSFRSTSLRSTFANNLFNLLDDHNVTDRFAVDYVNDPAWAEPLRMIAEGCAEPADDGGTNERNTRAGAKLVEMALAVDLVFAGELAQLCGPRVWDRVRALVGERLRSAYAFPDGNYRQYAVAAMLAAAHDDFSDIIVPLLSDKDQQTRLGTYRLWPDLRVSSLGRKWRDEVRGWTEEARADFVSELLHHRMDGEVAVFAADDASMVVKKAAVEGLMWTKSDAMLTVVLESMDTQTFDEVVREHVELMPTAMRSKTVTAMRSFIESSTDHPARLRAALDLVGIGETDLDGTIKDAMAALPAGDMRTLARHYIQPALEYLCSIDPAWASEWVAMQVAKGALYDCEYWLRFATAVPDSLAEKCLQRLKTEDLKNRRFAGMIAVIAARADARIAARVFAELRELRQHVDAAAGQPREFEWNLMRQLRALFHSFPDDVAAAGVIDSVTDGNALDLRVAADLLSRVARFDLDPLRVADDDLKALLRAYLKRSVGLVLDQDDFAGAEKANLASSIAQVGGREDVADLRTLIRADIKRMRRGRAAHAAGDRGPLGNGGSISYARWHIAAVMQLDSAAAEPVLIDLLAEPEYRADAASAMALDYVAKPDRSFDRTFRYDVMWSAREGRTPPSANDQRRVRYGAALHAEIELLRQEMGDARSVADVTELAKALAAVDGRGFAPAVLDVIAIPDRLRPYNRLDAMERLFMAGVVLPASAAFPLADSWLQDSDKYLLRRILALCPFVDDPTAGIAKVRDVLRTRPFWEHDDLREVMTGLGQSRSDAAIDLLYELGADARTFEQCEDSLINALAALDMRRARQLLLGFVDPDIRGFPLTARLRREDVLVERLTELARRSPQVAARLRQLCERDLPEHNRHLLSRVIPWLGTPEALAANLNLIDDARPSPVPQGIWEQLEAAFIERSPYGYDPNVFGEHARASNELRARLFRMAILDPRRRESARMLLGRIEEWRLEHGRPTREPRHPDLSSNESWPVAPA